MMNPPQSPVWNTSGPSMGYYENAPPGVVTSQPTVVMMPQPVYKDYIGLSIMNMILCCLPLGIAALIFSIQTRDSAQRQDAISAVKNSHTAFTLNMVALGIGIGIHLIWIAYVIYASVLVGSAVSQYYG